MEYLRNLPYAVIGSIGSVLIAKNLLKENWDNSKYKNILIISIYILLNCIGYNETYMPLQTFIKCLTLTLVIRQLFYIKVSTSFISSVVVLIILMLSEIILFVNPFFIGKAMLIRSNIFLFTLTNSCIMIIGYLLSAIKIIKNNINKFLYKFEKNTTVNEVIMLIFLLFGISFFYYLAFVTRYIEKNIIAFIIFLVILIILLFLYIFEKNKYNQLIYKYNNLFECSCLYEEELEKDKLVRHEHKNQLAVIRDMTKNKKVVNYINDIIDSYKNNDYSSISVINNLPKGGLRGIIYYKLSVIKSNKITFNLDVSKTTKRKLLKLSQEKIKVLSYIIGIFCDNAIEECKDKKSSNISIEVYNIGKDIKIIISNTINNKVDLQKIGEKGYTTKGKNHGNGIFLIKKILREHDDINLKTKIINNYFIQEINITT